MLRKHARVDLRSQGLFQGAVAVPSMLRSMRREHGRTQESRSVRLGALFSKGFQGSLDAVVQCMAWAAYTVGQVSQVWSWASME